jgi:hypothetical protein
LKAQAAALFRCDALVSAPPPFLNGPVINGGAFPMATLAALKRKSSQPVRLAAPAPSRELFLARE